MPTQQPQIDIDIDTSVLERLRMLPRYRVLLHNDDVNDMDHVVRALLLTIPSLSVDDAVRVMYEAHSAGVAVVVTCPHETAEYYALRLTRLGLTSTIEPD
jgi:ATP-dependent Clp protease adaptor protein ClpS